MKYTATFVCLAVVAVLSSGCVRRTVSRYTEYRGTNTKDDVIEDKIIWFWQDEFRRSK
ncbi:hypothetical protein [Pontiella sp.]|uniref:hypothetical protein n=1 Tax=Pontiella sp. TaxID=2837462 RepID=UPI0035634E4C